MSTNKSKPVYRLQLCVFDSQRDYPEGQEAKRILAYYPAECSEDEQTAVVGLAEALVTFANNFDQVCLQSSCDQHQIRFGSGGSMFALAERCLLRHAGRAQSLALSYTRKPNIYDTGRPASRHTTQTSGAKKVKMIGCLQVADRHWLTPSAREHDLQSILRQSYRQFVLLHGPLRPLLVRHTVRQVCYATPSCSNIKCVSCRSLIRKQPKQACKAQYMGQLQGFCTQKAVI